MKKFLNNEFGVELGYKIYSLQQEELIKILKNTKNKTKSQLKTLKNTILPRIALYKVLKEYFHDDKKAYDIVKKYMFDIVGQRLKKFYMKLEHLPNFYNVFRRLMAFSVTKSDNWETEIMENDKKSIKYNITKCLWYDACIENNCPELCKIFCQTDHIIYDDLKKVKFIRNKTLGNGDDYCDFCYLNKKH